GAVATTLITGALAARDGVALPVGSLTQMGRIRLGKRTENRNPLIKEFAPLASLDDVVFGGWDLFEDTAYEAALEANVLDPRLIEQFKDELSAIRPMKATFDPAYIRNLKATNVKKAATKMDLANAFVDDIEHFKRT